MNILISVLCKAPCIQKCKTVFFLGAQTEARPQILLPRQARTRGWMEVPGHHRGSRGQEEGQERGLPRQEGEGGEGQGRGAEGRQGRQADRPLERSHRQLWILEKYLLLYPCKLVFVNHHHLVLKHETYYNCY